MNDKPSNPYRHPTMLALYLIVAATLAMPASAAVSAEFWHHPTGGTQPTIDWVVDHTFGVGARAAITIWNWMRGE